MATPRKHPDDILDAGRPSAYRDEFCELVIEIGIDGGDVSEMAIACGVTKKTLYNYAQDNPTFLHKFMLAQEHAEAYHSKRVRAGLDKPGADFQGAANLKYMAQRFKPYREAVDLIVNPTPSDEEITKENAAKKYHEMINKPAT